MDASGTVQAASTSPDLIEVLRSRKAQAERFSGTYGAPRMARDTMLYWLAQSAKELREAADRKQVHIAASANKDQSTIYRFEQGLGWPRETDLFVAAYADDLDIEPMQIWEKALTMWQEAGDQANVADLLEQSKKQDSQAEAVRRARQKLAQGRRQVPAARAARKQNGH